MGAAPGDSAGVDHIVWVTMTSAAVKSGVARRT